MQLYNTLLKNLSIVCTHNKFQKKATNVYIYSQKCYIPTGQDNKHVARSCMLVFAVLPWVLEGWCCNKASSASNRLLVEPQ